MALTRIDHTGDGTTTQYDITFDLGYLRKEFVYVYLASNDYTTQLSYSWINSTRIQLDTPVENGVSFHIRRVIPRDAPVNDYQEGAILREDNLDDSFVQSIMILQEIQDGYLVPSGDFLIDSNLNMLQNEITNCVKISGLEDAIEPTAAVPLQQLLSYLTEVDFQGVIPLLQPRQQGDGVTTTFATPATQQYLAESFFINIDAAGQRPYTDFTVNNDGTVTFDEAPPRGADIDITLFQPANVGDLSGANVTATGSITPRTLGDRFANVVNIKDFGAKGDGFTDDTSAILSALSSAGNKGLTVLANSGEYVVSSNLFIPRGVKLVGASRETSVFRFTNDSGFILDRGATLQDLRIDTPTNFNGESILIDSSQYTADDTDEQIYGSNCISVDIIHHQTNSNFNDCLGVCIKIVAPTGGVYRANFYDVRGFRSNIFIDVESSDGWVNSNRFEKMNSWACATVLKMRRTGTSEIRSNFFDIITQTDINKGANVPLYDIQASNYITLNEIKHIDWDLKPAFDGTTPRLGSVGYNKDIHENHAIYLEKGKAVLLGAFTPSAGIAMAEFKFSKYTGYNESVRLFPVSSTSVQAISTEVTPREFEFYRKKVNDEIYIYVKLPDTQSSRWVYISTLTSHGFITNFYSPPKTLTDIGGTSRVGYFRDATNYSSAMLDDLRVSSGYSLTMQDETSRIAHMSVSEADLEGLKSGSDNHRGSYPIQLLADGSTGLINNHYYFGHLVDFGNSVNSDGYGTYIELTSREGVRLRKTFTNSWSGWVVL